MISNGRWPLEIAMNKQKGFTLIELVVVIVILGILAAIALPRFMNATDDAHRSSIKGTSGALASAVALARSQWELNRAKGITTPELNVAGFGDGTVDVDSTKGWPVGTDGGAALTTTSDCDDLWGALLQGSAPTIGAGKDYTSSVAAGVCTYTYNLDGNSTRTITYDSASGVVTNNVN